jgi:hypothetical protein
MRNIRVPDVAVAVDRDRRAIRAFFRGNSSI